MNVLVHSGNATLVSLNNEAAVACCFLLLGLVLGLASSFEGLK